MTIIASVRVKVASIISLRMTSNIMNMVPWSRKNLWPCALRPNCQTFCSGGLPLSCDNLLVIKCFLFFLNQDLSKFWHKLLLFVSVSSWVLPVPQLYNVKFYLDFNISTIWNWMWIIQWRVNRKRGMHSPWLKGIRKTCSYNTIIYSCSAAIPHYSIKICWSVIFMFEQILQKLKKYLWKLW